MNEPRFLLVPVAMNFLRDAAALETIRVRCESLPARCAFCGGAGCGDWVLLVQPPEVEAMGMLSVYLSHRATDWKLGDSIPALTMVRETIKLELMRWELEDRCHPRERRWKARGGRCGRRKAKPIPMAQRWSASAFVPVGAPVELLEGVLRRRAKITREVWRAWGWRRGADIWAPPLAAILAKEFLGWLKRLSVNIGLFKLKSGKEGDR